MKKETCISPTNDNMVDLPPKLQWSKKLQVARENLSYGKAGIGPSHPGGLTIRKDTGDFWLPAVSFS